MLNELGIALLADRERMPGRRLRFALELLRDYDLRRFRQLPASRIARKRGQLPQRVWDHLQDLERVGFLERGPLMRNGSGRLPATYRLARPYLLHGRELQDYLRETATQLKRRRLQGGG